MPTSELLELLLLLLLLFDFDFVFDLLLLSFELELPFLHTVCLAKCLFSLLLPYKNIQKINAKSSQPTECQTKQWPVSQQKVKSSEKRSKKNELNRVYMNGRVNGVILLNWDERKTKIQDIDINIVHLTNGFAFNVRHWSSKHVKQTRFIFFIFIPAKTLYVYLSNQQQNKQIFF